MSEKERYFYALELGDGLRRDRVLRFPYLVFRNQFVRCDPVRRRKLKATDYQVRERLAAGAWDEDHKGDTG